MIIPVDEVTVHTERHEITVICGGADYTVTEADFLSMNISATATADTEKLIFCDEKLRCIKKTESYLSLSDCPTAKIKEKLKGKFSPEVIEEVIKLFVSKGYLDDSRLSSVWAKELASTRLWGRTRIKDYLFRKGFSYDDISNAVDELDDEVLEENLENLIKINSKKYNLEDRGGYAKFGNFLYRYGYSWDMITPAMKKHIKNMIEDLE